MADFINNVRIRNRKVYQPRRETSERDYKILYRFNEANVRWMAAHFFRREKTETRGGALRNGDKLKIFLRYMADPGFQSGVGEDIGVHQTTVSKILTEVMDKILQKSKIWIKFPQSAEEMRQAKLEWQEKYTFPAAIGVLDCTHVRIKKPSRHGDEYINRKNYPSINVQATCNSKEIFTSVDASWPGSVHDSRIWHNSPIFLAMKENIEDALILGDEGYGIAPWLMTPYRNPQTPEELSYNKCFTKERVIIERCFGQVKQRFPILQYKIRTSLEKAPKIIVCCFILHNVAKYLKDDSIDLLNEEQGIAVPAQEHDEVENIRRRGQDRRNNLARIIHGQNN